MRETCPVCAGSRISVAYTGRPARPEWRDGQSFDVWQCADCTHRFINPMPEDATLARCYSASYHAFQAGHATGDLQQAIERARVEKRHRHVELHQDMDVLDVGCGSGTFLFVVREFVNSVFGVEPSQHGVETCRALGVPVFHGDFESYDREDDRSYDLITLCHVLEHHPEPIRLLDLCRKHLKDDGRLWIAVPNAGCFFARQLKAGWHSADIPVHLQQFTRSSLTLAVEKAGLQIEQCRTESENSLPGSASTLLRRFGIPGRLSGPLLKGSFSRAGWIGRRIDASGNGEAVLLTAAEPVA